MKKDKLSLIEKYPAFEHFNETAKEIRAKLQPYYDRYISEVSNDEMAISLELSVFLYIFCKIFNPERVLDLGSGFSSFVFRYYQNEVGDTVQVYSVDDNPQWLEKTCNFLKKHKLDMGNLYAWNTFRKRSYPGFDLIFNDLGGWEIRKRTLRMILGWVKKNGVIILDDLQKRSYAPYAKRSLERLKFKHYSLKSYTKDKFGRHSLLAIPYYVKQKRKNRHCL